MVTKSNNPRLSYCHLNMSNLRMPAILDLAGSGFLQFRSHSRDPSCTHLLNLRQSALQPRFSGPFLFENGATERDGEMVHSLPNGTTHGEVMTLYRLFKMAAIELEIYFRRGVGFSDSTRLAMSKSTPDFDET